MLPAIVDSLRCMATRNGAAFWSMYDVMGGQNSMLEWIKNGLGSKDYIHFSVKGARRMGENLVQAFEIMYETYKMQKQMGQTQFDLAWQNSFKFKSID